jgi:hypothetical protein
VTELPAIPGGDPTARPPICACGNRMAIGSTRCRSCAAKRGRLERYNWQDLTGKVFDRLTVIEATKDFSPLGCVWRCKCSCGEEVRRPAARLNADFKDFQKGKRLMLACPKCVKANQKAQRARARGASAP